MSQYKTLNEMLEEHGPFLTPEEVRMKTDQFIKDTKDTLVSVPNPLDVSVPRPKEGKPRVMSAREQIDAYLGFMESMQAAIERMDARVRDKMRIRKQPDR